eukprot:TRINITY_DN1139_c0_g1_i1.p1 TRINITY_DN1139_c0_g1~~TRINITY_DN1139_c0_g1_i1.p1  ORF type:complete len:126 (+),score=24.18 TRINITY_DN1139_c0_g1_i1:167-544(+)
MNEEMRIESVETVVTGIEKFSANYEVHSAFVSFSSLLLISFPLILFLDSLFMFFFFHLSTSYNKYAAFSFQRLLYESINILCFSIFLHRDAFICSASSNRLLLSDSFVFTSSQSKSSFPYFELSL